MHGRGLPVGIIWESWAGKLRVFLIQPVIIISRFIKFSSWLHESHCHLFPWFLIRRFFRCQYISLQCFHNHRVLFLRLKSTSQAYHFYWGLPPNMAMNFLGYWLSLDGCIATFIVLVLFSNSTAAFLTKRSLWFTWWLFSVGGLGGTWNPSDIKNYLTSEIKLLKKVEAMPNGKTTSYGSA